MLGTIKESIKALFSICKMAKDSGLPSIEKEEIKSLINRNSLQLLNLD